MSTPFVWHDLTASPAAADRAREFYGELFGWTIAVAALWVPFATTG